MNESRGILLNYLIRTCQLSIILLHPKADSRALPIFRKTNPQIFVTWTAEMPLQSLFQSLAVSCQHTSITYKSLSNSLAIISIIAIQIASDWFSNYTFPLIRTISFPLNVHRLSPLTNLLFLWTEYLNWKNTTESKMYHSHIFLLFS